MNAAKIININSNIQKPKKQTYKAMYKYSKAINDKDSAKMFKSLDNQAKARLHNKKSEDAIQRILDYSEKYAEKVTTPKEMFFYCVKQARNTFEYIKEGIISRYYGFKA